MKSEAVYINTCSPISKIVNIRVLIGIFKMVIMVEEVLK